MFEKDRRMKAGTRATAVPSSGGPPQTLIGIQEAKFFVIGTYDERGREETILAMEFGGKFYADRDAAAWARQLRPLSKWLTKQIEKQRAAEAPVRIPETDAVDVID